MNGKKNWYKLDNAATIIPSTVNGSDSRVFRVVCELNEPVDRVRLQEALDDVIRRYPHFNCVLRKGFFWYYLDGCDLKPTVTLENLRALSPIYCDGRKTLLYRVSYYENRINLEMFHVLADGTGAFFFFRELVITYLSRAHDLYIDLSSEPEISREELATDAFREYYQKKRGNRQLKEMMAKKAYKLKGRHDENLLNHLLEATVSAKALHAAAKAKNTTVGIFTVALVLMSILEEMDLDKKNPPVVITVPVNLRQFFPSNTTRNFFGVINVSYDASRFDGRLETLLPVVEEAFERQLEKQAITDTMNSYSQLVHNWAIKMVPLFIKDLVIEQYYIRSQRGVTTNVSNVGKIRMPEETLPYIKKFVGFMSSPTMQICILTFEDYTVFGAVSDLKVNTAMMHLCRHLRELGIDVELATNDYEKGETIHASL